MSAFAASTLLPTKEWLWLSRLGRFTESGIGQMVARRGDLIGLKVHPH
jgi:hypothetical protein